MFLVRAGVIRGAPAVHWVHLPSTVFARGTVLPQPPHLCSAFCFWPGGSSGLLCLYDVITQWGVPEIPGEGGLPFGYLLSESSGIALEMINQGLRGFAASGRAGRGWSPFEVGSVEAGSSWEFCLCRPLVCPSRSRPRSLRGIPDLSSVCGVIEVTYRIHFASHLMEADIFHYFEPVGLIFFFFGCSLEEG